MPPTRRRPIRREFQGYVEEQSGGTGRWLVIGSALVAFTIAAILVGILIVRKPAKMEPVVAVPAVPAVVVQGTEPVPEAKANPNPKAAKKTTTPRVVIDGHDPGSLLRWLTDASEAARAVELDSNKFAYKTELDKMQERFGEVYGNTVSWRVSVSVGVVDKNADGEIVDQNNRPANPVIYPEGMESGPYFVIHLPEVRSHSPSAPMFRLTGVRSWVQATDYRGKAFRPLSAPVQPSQRDWAMSIRDGDKAKMTGIVSEVVFEPSPTALSKDRTGNWGYTFFVILSNLAVERE